MSRLPDFNQDTLLLTANNRLARAYTAQYNQHQISSGRTAWRSARILPLSAWLQQCWLDISDSWPDTNIPRLLNSVQESLLWERIVRANLPADNSTNPATLARLAQQAWQLQQAWRIKSAPGEPATLDVQRYAEWALLYATRCRQENWTDSARLPDIAAGRIRAGAIEVPRQLILAGFETITPQTQELLAALTSFGCAIEYIALPLIPTSASRTEFSTALEEIRAAANWSRERLEKKPAARIAIVVPDLASKRAQIQRVFDEVLAPENLFPAYAANRQNRLRRPFNISQGIPLLQYPLIGAIFNLLSMKQPALETSVWSAIIRSPFLRGAESEFDSRSLCDFELCRTREFSATIKSVQKIAGNQSRLHYAPALAEILHALQKSFNELPKFCSAREWVRLFSELLQLAGWPGERNLSSEEFQLVESWRELLDQFISTDPVAAKLDYQQAMSLLRRLAAEQQFQPESFNEPVQVLGIYEALGQHFDHLWLLGLDEQAWPLRPRPSPFLPLAAQIAAGVPQASVEGAAHFARQGTQHLLAAAGEIVVSHTNRENDQMLRPSALIEHVGPVAAGEIVPDAPPTLYRAIRRSAQRETLENDYTAAEIAANVFRGGTALFKYQAACPFRAFAQVRLNAQAWPTPRIGLDPAERGQILHKAMELFWLKLETHARLLEMDDVRLSAQVSDAVSHALADWQAKHQDLPRRFGTLEKRRFNVLIQDWLVLERQRLPFSVQNVEHELQLSLAGLSIKLRQDRVDSLPDGSVAIIDYKTGEPHSLPWEDDSGRPEEPQLPLYALASVKPVSALLFGKIKTGESAIIGIADTAVCADADSEGFAITDATGAPTLDQRIETWRGELTQLAQSFRAGDARVDPKIPATCRYCHLSSLCRKNEILDAGFLAETDDEANDEQ